ncbi:hypothetical protein ABID23_000307 [Bartonella silvatica]|uniref:Uncharacterized protein n=1 Tax=Bartonella silvatica TaxID=357760 RepID=A0ABV2HGD0_9HYPH
MIHFTGMNIRRQMAYGKNFTGEFILALCYYFIQFIFIDEISSFSGRIGSYSRDEVILSLLYLFYLGCF